MFCNNCGKEIKNESRFCEYCGSKVVGITSKEELRIDENKTLKALGESIGGCIVIFIIGIVLGNIFGRLDNEVGIVFSKGLLYSSGGMGILLLIIDFIMSIKLNKKMPVWMLIILGIIIATIIINGITAWIAYDNRQKEKQYEDEIIYNLKSKL